MYYCGGIAFLCPLHVMAGAYSVTLFRPSVILSFHPSVILSFCHHQFPFIILVTVARIQLKFDIIMDISQENTGQIRFWSWSDDF
jgi:hypothetical protein